MHRAEPVQSPSVQAGEADALAVECRRCGRRFPAPPKGHYAIYRPECRHLMLGEYQRDFKRRLREKRERERQGLPELSREIPCARCKQPFIPPAKNSRLCQSCQREENREYSREHHQQQKAARGVVVESQEES